MKRKYGPARTLILISEYKICEKCREEKHISNFNNQPKKSDGYESDCKTCKQKWKKEREAARCSTILGHLTFLYTKTRNTAKERNKEFDITLNDLVELYSKQAGLCAITKKKLTCGRNNPLGTTISIDRINSNKGYVKNNIQLVCARVNVIKSNMTKEELIAWCHEIINNYI